ncbi:hypothetical protein [Pseudovibrio sp. WM33]|uniref:hypothetical protein n=1 Tax=Pseudovibrio sp. WM33 TaxID=1735585 RepID=UPI0007AEBAD4|nr:hypothetical protein [Pseudovibrio sp. WM33]KZL23309.1 hypothetical protein PsWM33_03498 [Pseudovibrio sp. WM33]
MTEEKPSAVCFQNLLHDAENYKRPDVRIETLGRLKVACDAIESGEAKRIIEESTCTKKSVELKINATNVQKYVRAMGWPGPQRTTIERKNGASSLKPYVEARENERSKTTRPKPRRISEELEMVLREINSIEVRQYVRNLMEHRKRAESQYNALVSGLRKIPALSIDEILNVSKTPYQTNLASSANLGITAADRILLGTIYEKLTDNETLTQHFNLKFDGTSLQQGQTTKRLLTKKELDALQRLASPFGAGMSEQA